MKAKTICVRQVIFLAVMTSFLVGMTVSAADAAEIVIYQKANFKGKSVTLKVNAPDLRVPTINMNDKVVSIRLKNVTSVALFESINYHGKCETFINDVADLRIKQVGILGISSIKLNSRCPKKKPGVIFFENKNYKGQSKRVTANTHMFAYTPLEKKISSFKLDGVASVAVFSSSSFDGNCQVFTSNQPDLSTTSIGDNTIESVKINGNCKCNGPYVFLFEHNNYAGRRFRLTKSSADLSSKYSGNMNNKVSSIKMFNMNSAALYNDKSYNGKCTTMKSHIPNMASTLVGNDALSSIKFQAECKQERYLKIRNNSAAIVKFSWLTDDPLHPNESVKLAVGQEKSFNYKLGRKINIIVYFGYPVADTASNFVDFKQKCSYKLTLNDNHFIVAKGTLLNPKCENVIIPTI